MFLRFVFGFFCVVSVRDCFALPAISLEGNDSVKISINQAGYFVSGKKVGFLHAEKPMDLELVNIRTREAIKIDGLEHVIDGLDSSIKAYKFEFSHVRQVGDYVIRTEALRSPRFEISYRPFHSAIVKMLRSYFLQRCGVSIDDKYTGVHHAACHTDDAMTTRDYLSESTAEQSSIKAANLDHNLQGGWHDAGDFGKYVSTTAVASLRLLELWINYEDLVKNLDLAIPESSNKIPDILDEVAVGLDFLLKMQRSDGIFFRKVGGDRWPKLMPPDQDWQRRFVYGVATDDTAKSVAALALGAFAFHNFDRDKSDKYRQAAERSWKYLTENQTFHLDWKKSDDSGSGPYKDNTIDKEASLFTDIDDRFMAAAALYVLTKNNSYVEYIREYQDWPVNLYEWKDPSYLGKVMLRKLSHSNTDKSEKESFQQVFKEQLVRRADEALNRSQQSIFEIANHRFVWGSNKMAIEEGLILLNAYEIKDDKKYLNAALAQANYILGINVFSQAFVTGVGERGVKNVSHIYTRGENIRIPGLVVGGPNNLAQSGVAPKNQGQLSYADDARSYATNEYAIDYNASAIALLVKLTAAFL